MKTITILLSCILAMVLLPCVAAQQSTNALSSSPRYDTGVILSDIYTNDCLGFSLAIPEGWIFSKEAGDSDSVRIGTHMPDGSIDLLMLNRHTDPQSFNRILVIAQDAARFNGTPRDYVARSVQGFVDRDPARYELLHNASPVEFGGKQFYRADNKQNLQNGGAIYTAYVFTKFREHFLGAIVMTNSASALDEAAKVLRHVSFTANQVNTSCVTGDNSLTGRSVGAVGSLASGTVKAARVRISSGVANALLVKRVAPQLPEAARTAGAKGSVVLKIVVDKEGNVSGDIGTVSGDASLVPAAVDAVKQWKFKPYLLNGEPVEAETTVTVTFEAAP